VTGAWNRVTKSSYIPLDLLPILNYSQAFPHTVRASSLSYAGRAEHCEEMPTSTVALCCLDLNGELKRVDKEQKQANIAGREINSIGEKGLT
jgi:hypothetical protein